MKRRWVVVLAPAGLAVVLVVFVAALLLIKLMWAWTVPDLFPGAVAQKLVAADISWLAALKLAAFIALLSAVAGIRRRK